MNNMIKQFKQITRIASIMLFIGLFSISDYGSDDTDKSPSSADIKSTLVETLNAYLNNTIADDAAGMAILVVQDDIVTYLAQRDW